MLDEHCTSFNMWWNLYVYYVKDLRNSLLQNVYNFHVHIIMSSVIARNDTIKYRLKNKNVISHKSD